MVIVTHNFVCFVILCKDSSFNFHYENGNAELTHRKELIYCYLCCKVVAHLFKPRK